VGCVQEGAGIAFVILGDKNKLGLHRREEVPQKIRYFKIWFIL